MTVIVTWRCDGCDEEANATRGQPQSWQKISVTLEGFKGHPVGDYANGEHSFELCPDCQKKLRENANPKEWVRTEKAA